VSSDVFLADPQGQEPPRSLLDNPDDELQEQLDAILAEGERAISENDKDGIKGAKDQLRALRDHIGTLSSVTGVLSEVAAELDPADTRGRKRVAIAGFLVSAGGEILQPQKAAAKDLADVMIDGGWLKTGWYQTMRVKRAEKELRERKARADRRAAKRAKSSEVVGKVEEPPALPAAQLAAEPEVDPSSHGLDRAMDEEEASEGSATKRDREGESDPEQPESGKAAKVEEIDQAPDDQPFGGE
jgi:hypothetical protein